MSRREFIGFAAVACVACCIGPIVGMLGAIIALGVMSTMLIEVAGLGVAAAAAAALIIVRRRTDTYRTDPASVAVELTGRVP